MPKDKLTLEERDLLLKEARQTLELQLAGKPLAPLNLEDFPPKLREPGATFVTLTKRGELRGCVGALEPYQPLIEDVREHVLAAAFQDYRFPPVIPSELDELSIEISRLTQPQPLVYEKWGDLIERLCPGVDGVILRDGLRRATFLPQVWQKIADPTEFLGHLCMKMGSPANLWKHKKLDVMIYRVEEFHEAG